MMRRSLYFCLTLLLLFVTCITSQVCGASLTLTVPSIESPSGTTISVPITTSNVDDLGALQAKLKYNASVLRCKSIMAGPLAQGALLQSDVTELGEASIGLASVNGISGNGELLVVEFQLLGSAGKASDITLESIQAWKGESHLELVVNSIAGKVTVTEIQDDDGATAEEDISLATHWLLFAGVILLLLLFAVLLTQAKKRSSSQSADVPLETKSHTADSIEHIFCSECGTKNRSGAKFCSACGSQMS